MLNPSLKQHGTFSVNNINFYFRGIKRKIFWKNIKNLNEKIFDVFFIIFILKSGISFNFLIK